MQKSRKEEPQADLPQSLATMIYRKHAPADDVTIAKMKTRIGDDGEEVRSENHLRTTRPADTAREAEIRNVTRVDMKVRRKIVPSGNAKDRDRPMNGAVDTKGAIPMMIEGRAEETARTIDAGGADPTPQSRNRDHHPHALIDTKDGTSIKDIL